MSLSVSKFSVFSTFIIKRKSHEEDNLFHPDFRDCLKMRNNYFSANRISFLLLFDITECLRSFLLLISIHLFLTLILISWSPSFWSLSTSSSGALWQQSINPGSSPTWTSADTCDIWTQIQMCSKNTPTCTFSWIEKHQHVHMDTTLV